MIHLYEHIGTDRGAYFMEGLNLRKLTVKSNTYDFYTRIYPIGKDGITPEIMIGVPYIDNHQYTDKIVPKIWKDERYTITENLIEDARAKLETASRPYTAYTADVADLAAQSEEYGLLDYDIGDTVWIVSKTENTRTKQRIVKMTEYPKDPQKNTCELSSVVKTFEQIQTVSESRTKRILRGGYWTTEEVQAAITSSEEKIATSVQAIRTESRDMASAAEEAAKLYTDDANNKTVEQMTNEYQTMIEQTSIDLNISIRSMEETVTAQGEDLESFKQENETYFHYTRIARRLHPVRQAAHPERRSRQTLVCRSGRGWRILRLHIDTVRDGRQMEGSAGRRTGDGEHAAPANEDQEGSGTTGCISAADR